MRRMRKPSHVRQKAIDLYLNTDMSAQEVADDAEVSRQTIHRWIREAGINPQEYRPNGASEQRDRDHGLVQAV